ncbi:MAG: HlyD family secretion protein, partial [Selenomonadaceae bacterium]|nr:HlyD family secretion protein [Selenomonadaceae bacterium]
MYRGNDAVILATQRKDGILTAEQVKLSFDSVGGRLINEAVREGQIVTAG